MEGDTAGDRRRVNAQRGVVIRRVVKHAIPSLAGLAATIGDPAVRNMGTMGGSLANNDPAADYPAAAMALDAVFTPRRASTRRTTYFRGIFETALDEDEILIKISYAIPKRAALREVPQPGLALLAVLGVRGRAR